MAVAKLQPDRRRRIYLLVGLGLLAAGVLTLGLALGLTVNRRERKHEQDDSSSSSKSSSLPPLQHQPLSNSVLDHHLLDESPQTREYNFTIGKVTGAPDGVNRTMLVVNGLYPGPTIQANQGDRLVVHVHNNLSNATSIHWHGLFQNGTNFYDGTSGITECGIPPGQSLTYNFTFGQFSGTTWWHAHSTQYTDGISGALIVHPSESPSQLPEWDEDFVLQLSDWYHDMSEDLLDQYLSPFGIQGTQGNEPVPDGGTLNGLGQYYAKGSGGSYSSFAVQRNKTYRLRLINTGSFAAIRFSVDSHPLILIEADGTLLKPTTISSIKVEVAQRYSVLLHANATAMKNATYWMRAEVQSDMFTYDQPGQNLDIRGVFRYTDSPSPTGLPGDTSSSDPGPGASNLPDVDGKTSLVPLTVESAPNSTRGFPISFSFQNTADGRFLGFMNTTSWAPLGGETTLLSALESPKEYSKIGGSIAANDQFMITQDSIQAIDLEIDNLDDGDHPFHLHGHRPWIMGTGRGRYIGQPLNNTNPLRRDTVLIPAYSHVVLRFVTDNPGLWAFHCHLAWHMAAGLLMQINSLPSKLAEMDIPRDIISQCHRSG